MPFVKGQSGNPGGRPKIVAAIRELAQDHAPEAITRLVQAMRSKDDKVAMAAAIALLDRGIGRPVQQTELTGADGTPLGTERQISPNDLARRVAFILQKALRERQARVAAAQAADSPRQDDLVAWVIKRGR